MTLFRSNFHAEVWRTRWCESCYQPDEAARRLHGKAESQCSIWAKAMKTDRKPVEWDRNTRTDEMERAIKCNAYLAKPPVIKRNHAGAQDYDVPLFDVDETEEVGFVPVEGWPQRDGSQGVDHQ